MGHRKLSGGIGGGLCAASFSLILASVASHLRGPGLYLFLIVVFLLGVVLFVRAARDHSHPAGGEHAEAEIERPVPKPGIERPVLTLPPPSPPTGPPSAPTTPPSGPGIVPLAPSASSHIVPLASLP